MKIKPIKNKKDYDKALKIIEKLWDAKPNTHKGDVLEVITTLVEKYEEENYYIDSPDPIQAIKFIMEQKNIKRSALEQILGKNRTSEILNKRRKITLSAIRKLNRDLHIPPSTLIKDYKLAAYKTQVR